MPPYLIWSDRPELHGDETAHPLSSLLSYHGSAARVSVRIGQVSSVRHRKLIWFDVRPQHLLPVTCRPNKKQKNSMDRALDKL